MAYQHGASSDFVKPEPAENSLPPPQSSAAANKWDESLKRTEEDPFSDAAWDALLECAEESGDNERIKAAYDSLLQKYPNIVSGFFTIALVCNRFTFKLRLCFAVNYPNIIP